MATATEIYDYLRLLYARCGEVHCIYCDGLVKRDSVDEAAEAVLKLGEGTRLNVLFPVMSATAAGAQDGEGSEARARSRQKRRARTKVAQKPPILFIPMR